MSNGKKNNNSNSSTPLVIIGLVLVIALVGFWWFYSQPRTTTNRTATNRTATPAPALPANAPAGAPSPHMLGSATASVTIEEFADFQCSACASIHTVLKNVHSAYGNRIKFVFRHFPLTQIHRNAFDAALAAEAAGFQGRFWDMQNLLFVNQQAWSNAPDARKIFEEYAQRINLDVERFRSDMTGMNASQRVQADMSRGRAFNVNSTPTIFINGTSVPFEQMNFESLRQIIDAELQKTQGGQTNAPATSAPANTTGANTTGANKPVNAK